MKKIIPQRGDIIKLELNLVSGHEQRGFRPVMVLSSGDFNEATGLALVCPITSKVKGYPFEVPISSRSVKGVVLSDQIRTVDFTSRKIKIVEKADRYSIGQVLDKIKLILD